jgi:hypothetical protein
VDALTISILANVVLGLVLFGVLYRKPADEPERLSEPADALARYRVRYPAASGRVDVATDGRAALIAISDGSVGLIERRGRRWNARVVEPREILAVDRADDGAITVRFADFGWPRARVELSDPDTCQRWIERLTAMRDSVARAREQGVPRA